MENKYKLPIGTTFFRVEWCDEPAAIKLATIEGWKDGDSLFDYIDPISNDAYMQKRFKTKPSALQYAKAIQARDIFRSPAIEQVELIEEKIDGTNFREWQPQERWILDGEELVEAA